jgi:hypothetical protein
MRTSRNFLCLAASLLLLAALGRAQVVTAGFYGNVVDPNGARVPNARVTLSNTDRGTTLTRETDATGEVSFASVPIGEYVVVVEAKGFKTTRRPGLVLSAGQDLRLTLEMELGQVSETVLVTSETPLVNTANAEQRTNLESARVQELPIARRDWTNLLNLTPGAQVGGSSVRLNGLPP